jgi:hypothetical protein
VHGRDGRCLLVSNVNNVNIAWTAREALLHLADAAWPAGDVHHRASKPHPALGSLCSGSRAAVLGVEERRQWWCVLPLLQHHERQQSWCAPQAPTCPRSRRCGPRGAGAAGGNAGGESAVTPPQSSPRRTHPAEGVEDCQAHNAPAHDEATRGQGSGVHMQE